jgi:hypothetical protein
MAGIHRHPYNRRNRSRDDCGEGRPTPNHDTAGEVDLERIALLRKEITFEHTLLSSRLSAFLTFQSFLFAAYAISGAVEHQQHRAFGLFSHFGVPLIGYLVSALILLAIGCRMKRLTDLNACLHRRLHGGDGSPLSDLAGDLCIPSRAAHRWSLAYAWGVPVICAAAWLVVGPLSIVYHHAG